ncbi:gamma-glutamyltransferase [Marinithermofilum abyssi]|uniref:Gamma-glutamyltransferase n=1 Tax=Marinithermofilum abyssi TaxID=1571185 RepID=A0A8J2VJD8_9BACL|nr:gamma-glutamyltransferase family protein [Marinithermofilum abyssi]GGE27449.1 gamma-glutamyltransferase [Marinithermofilum abyssi]
MKYDPLYNPYPSQRMTVYARKGMVATSQPLAAQAGLDMLKRGGNAVDAAVAAAACLTVVEPTSNGIGGDAFAIVWHQGRMYGLNASGPAPRALTVERVRQAGYDEMPEYGWLPVTVPGAPAAWAALSHRFGRLPLKEVLEPAACYAEEGYPLTPVLARFWQQAVETYRQVLHGEEFRHWFATFAPDEKAPRAGEMWSSPAHADTLREIGESDGESFYRGELAEQIHRFAQSFDAPLSKEDLADYQPEWVDPISVCYRGYDIWEMPPNGQGLVALMVLNILKGFSLGEKESIESYHRQVEAIKLAFADGRQTITDPRDMTISVEDLLSEAYTEKRRSLIGHNAIHPSPGQPLRGGTVYLAAADGEGNMVSFIQSNYMGFGSGLVVPETGISLHNRGHTFSLKGEDANCLAPGKRTYHTIMPGFVTRGGDAIGPFGVMGAFMQPQGHVQVILNSVDYYLNPQAALNAPRWQWMGGKKVAVEQDVPAHIVKGLLRRGHDIRIAPHSGRFGRGQIIWRDPVTGVLSGGTEPRTDGAIAVW